MENKIIMRTKTTAKDYKTFVFFNMFLKKRAMFYFTIIAAVLSLAAIIGKFTGKVEMAGWYFYVCLAFLGLIILQYILFETSVKKFLASDRLVIENERMITISETGILEKGGKEKGAGEFQWDMFYFAYETKPYFYLYINTMQAIILPKRDLKREDLIALEKLVKEKLGKKFLKR